MKLSEEVRNDAEVSGGGDIADILLNIADRIASLEQTLAECDALRAKTYEEMVKRGKENDELVIERDSIEQTLADVRGKLEVAKAQVRMWAGSADQIKQERDALKSELSASIQREGEIEKELGEAQAKITQYAKEDDEAQVQLGGVLRERDQLKQELEEAREQLGGRHLYLNRDEVLAVKDERDTLKGELEEAQERFKVVMRVQGNLIKERDTLQARVAELESNSDHYESFKEASHRR